MATRLDSRLENVGAEFLVLGHLLVEGIEAHKAYTNYPGYDIVAVNPETKRQCRIQVKSRWATDYNRTFPIKNFDCDYVVLAALNRGFRDRRRRGARGGKHPPEFYVFPVEVVAAARKPESKWGIVPLARIDGLEQYRDGWSQIKEYLGSGEAVTRPPPDPVRGAEVARKLRGLGVKGILVKAAEAGYITQLACKMPECFCPEELGGACYFEPVTDELTDWSPTHEHFPRSKREGGHRSVDNAVLAHRLCNRIDYSICAGRPYAGDLDRVRKAREAAAGS